MKKISEASFITKASAQYCGQFFLRAEIKLIPGIGGALDTLLSGLGARYQYERLESFISELQEKFKKLDQANNVINMEPSEELFDFVMQIFDQVVKTRSEEKRKRFANLVANQIINQVNWDEAETATRLLADLSDLHINLLTKSLNSPKCDGVFEGLHIVTFADYKTSKMPDKPPTNISTYFPGISLATLQMHSSELVAKGLFYDESIGRFGGPKAMSFLRATDMAKWLMDWISETKIKSE